MRSLPPRATIAVAMFLVGLVASGWALQLVGTQILLKPRVQPKPLPTVMLFCQGPTLLNFTDPLPLVAGDNGTIVFGCGMSSGAQSGLTPALTITRAGVVSASFSLPGNVSILLLPNAGVIPGPLSQSQCAASGILLTSNVNATIPAGSYSYCESFQDASVLTDVSISWSEA